jgi:hypothetical protein
MCLKEKVTNYKYKMKQKAISIFVCIVGIVLSLTSCKPSTPSDIIQPDDMEDILYDYHIAQGMAGLNQTDTITSRVYKLAVLKKHEVSEAEFDSSMVYYMRHTDSMHKIYESLADRLSKEAQAQGISIAQLGGTSSDDLNGDTASVWTGPKAFVLNRYSPFNMQSFALDCDTSYHKGDGIILSFQSSFIQQDGSRNGTVVLAVTFKNDSTAQQVVTVSSSSDYTLRIFDDNKLGIKSVRCLFMLGSGNSLGDVQSLTTLQMMVIYNVNLIRMHRSNYKSPSELGSSSDSVADKSNRPMPQTVPPGGMLPMGARPMPMK